MDEKKYLSKEAWKNRTLKKEKSACGYFVDESSLIDENVKIGKGTKIWHFSHILSGTTIGKNCSFGQNCVVGPNVKIGSGVKVQNNVSLYEGVEVEEDVFIGPSAVFTNVTNPRAFIIRKAEFKKTLLKRGCTIGANATIICGVSIGEYALIGSGAVVNKDVLPHALMVGVPAKQIGWVSRAGNTLEFDKNNEAFDTYDNSKYKIINNTLDVT
jgi:UDP-2-acetamido-3-amino-2,3-dideoxy-glucuronate N-acetyltransferase